MNRRRLGTLLCSLVVTTIFSDHRAFARSPTRDFAALIAELNVDQVTAARLGASYLVAADRGRLANTLRRLRARNPVRIEELRGAIAELAQEDFARRDLVVVDGWVLARAEAEALALVHIARGS